MTQELLRIEDLNTFIGEYHILQGVNISMREGGVAALLGRNGAGKTTTLRSIMGLAAPRGRISFDGRDIVGMSTAAISRLGIGYVPETLRLAARSRAPDRARIDWITNLFPALRKFWHSRSGYLSGGQKQMLAIAKALVEPKRLILVDEPTKGLAPSVIAELITALKQLTQQSTSILLVEQNFHFAASLATQTTVLESGQTTWQGTLSDIAKDEALRRRLLGVSVV
jgi:branched-chain amino acid transport system ATP-binding protein